MDRQHNQEPLRSARSRPQNTALVSKSRHPSTSKQLAKAKTRKPSINVIDQRLEPVRKELFIRTNQFVHDLLHSKQCAVETEKLLRKALEMARTATRERASQRLKEWSSICAEYRSIVIDLRDLALCAIDVISSFLVICLPGLAIADVGQIRSSQSTELFRTVRRKTENVTSKMNRTAQRMDNFKSLFKEDLRDAKKVLSQANLAASLIGRNIEAPPLLNARRTAILDNSSVPGLLESMSILLGMKSITLLTTLIEGSTGQLRTRKAQGATHNTSQLNVLRCLLGVGHMIQGDISSVLARIESTGVQRNVHDEKSALSTRHIHFLQMP
ncbi:hypothetical protein SCHPADRAFT_673057 [Schizopora paradoxa]|uniref:Uncharacterized protein n=1 Tax=Schizopora paradoxa TaxID=27342 RepID=A0A0H2RBQ4_9AGAM|nr:hypothetical protein SCHPADRAFT_673057 [Schizopora paradoxa]